MHTSFLLHTLLTCYLLNSQTDFNELLCGISITHGFGLIYKPDAAKNEIIQSDLDFQWNFGEIQTQSSLIQDPECVFKNDKIWNNVTSYQGRDFGYILAKYLILSSFELGLNEWRKVRTFLTWESVLNITTNWFSVEFFFGPTRGCKRSWKIFLRREKIDLAPVCHFCLREFTRDRNALSLKFFSFFHGNLVKYYCELSSKVS